MNHTVHNKLVSFIWSIANKYFHKHKPLRSMEEVAKEILDLEQQKEG